MLQQLYSDKIFIFGWFKLGGFKVHTSSAHLDLIESVLNTSHCVYGDFFWFNVSLLILWIPDVFVRWPERIEACFCDLFMWMLLYGTFLLCGA